MSIKAFYAGSNVYKLSLRVCTAKMRRRGMYRFVIPPVGWGFMFLHMWKNSNRKEKAVVVDGGTLCPLNIALQNIGDILPQLKAPWAWIISHLDFDHYSIVLELVEKLRWWNEPSVIMLPASYNLDECMKATVMYVMLADLLATLMKVPPVYKEEIASILSRVRRKGRLFGVRQGQIIKTGDIKYYILWPPNPSININIRDICSRLAKELYNKLHMYLEEHAKDLKGYKCQDIEKCEEEYLDILREIFPINIEKPIIDLDEILNNEIPSENVNRDKTLEEMKTYKFTRRTPYSFDRLYTNAAIRFRDYNLQALHYSYVNAFSVALLIMSKNFLNTIQLLHLAENYPVLISAISFANNLNNNMILYLSDLTGKELDLAVQYYVNFCRSYNNNRCYVLALVAPHHGNSYSDSLSQIYSNTLIISRCDDRSHVRYGFKNLVKLLSKTSAIPIITSHNVGIVIEKQ